MDVVSHDIPWKDAARVQQMKSSFVVKHKKDDATTSPNINLARIQQIAVANNIPVSNIGVSKKGNTFIHCPSVEHRDKLQPLISADAKDKDVHSIKEKSPHITVTDIIQTGTEEITKETILTQIRSQNSEITTLIDSGNEFEILFVKKSAKSNYFSAAI